MRPISHVLAVALLHADLAAASPARSHPPLRQAPAPARRPLEKGPGLFVDARRGDDSRGDGSEKAPWRTVRHALTKLQAGQTLYLRGGVYYENVTIAVAGRRGAPITLRSYPGEQAVLDGGLSEFFEAPATAWEPHPAGAPGEYRSKRTYPNLREVLGSFGDSMIGLQTYFHAVDFRSRNEWMRWKDVKRRQETDVEPLYCGPGVWYDRATGRIHARLAHTHLPPPVANYRGETDPRKLPLVLAAYRSVALHLDGARHVRFQDLIVRGGGYATVVLDQASDVEFDNVTLWCGTYGIRATGVERLRLLRCGLYGNLAPWTFRADASKRDYPGRPHRNISRLNTHALIEIDSGRESSVHATPQNDDWEIAHSEFTDAHDGLYLGAINVRFHHNRIDNLQDDGIYLSPMYRRHRLEQKDPEIHIYQNVFGRMLTALAFGGPETQTRDRVFVYRNVFDLRGAVLTGRPAAEGLAAGTAFGKVIGDHGSPPWSRMNVYHNTFVMTGRSRTADMALFAGTKAGLERRVFNNVLLHLDRLPGYPGPAAGVVADGNLYWSPAAGKGAADLFRRYRASAAFAQSKAQYAAGSSTHSRVGDPKFMSVEKGDFRLQAGSPAIDAGVPIPAEWSDPLRATDRGKPDVGAVPHGAGMPAVGRVKAD